MTFTGQAAVVPGGGSTPTIRLVVGHTSSEGQVEIYSGGRWTAVCDEDWDEHEAAVVCRMMGIRLDCVVYPWVAF
jgi:hypothetical protein